MKKESAIIGFVATAVICFVLGYVLGTSNVDKGAAGHGEKNTVAHNAEGNGAPAGAPQGGGADSDLLPIGDSPSMGGANAAVTIIEFSEFQCPFCSRVLPTTAEIKKAYGDDVRVVFKHNPLSFHKDAPLASEAAMAAHEQGKFWEMHDLLFANQRELGRENLDKYAQQIGLDMQKFKAALDSGKFKARVQQDVDLANKVGARGTPNFFVNGIKVVGAKPFDEFKTIIDKELAAARQAGGGSAYAARVKANFEAAPAAPAGGDKGKAPSRPPANDDAVYKVPVGSSPIKGSPDGIVTIVEFSDFQCPFCGRVNPTIKQILDENPGKVRVAFRQLPLPFHKDAEPAAIASLAAHQQGKFWEMHDILFQNQRALSADDLKKYAQQIGLNMQKFEAALSDPALKKQVEEDKALAGKVGARGTPHFFVNGKRLSGAQPYEQFKAAVEDGIKRAAPFAARGLKGDALYNALIATGVEEFKAPAGDAGGAPAVDNTIYEVPVGSSPIKGNAKAPVKIVLFSDFQCPFCSRVGPTLVELEKKYGDKVAIVFKHQPLPFHKDAPLAAQASMAAHQQGKFWEMHDVMFANQRALTPEDLEKYAQQIGLNMERFKQDLNSEKIKAAIEEDKALGAKVGARGTPTLFVNGHKIVGAQPASAFEPLIDAELKK